MDQHPLEFQGCLGNPMGLSQLSKPPWKTKANPHWKSNDTKNLNFQRGVGFEMMQLTLVCLVFLAWALEDLLEKSLRSFQIYLFSIQTEAKLQFIGAKR